MGWISTLKGVIRKLFYRQEDVFAIFGVRPMISDKMIGEIQTWRKIYEGDADWLTEEIGSAGFASIISAEAARLATVELEFEISGSPRAEYLGEKMSAVKDKIRTQLEYACALGGMMLKPNGDGVDFIRHGDFIPVDLDSNGNITGAIFISTRQSGNDFFTRFEYQRFETYMVQSSGMYKVQVGAFNKRENADATMKKLKAAGFEAFITTRGGTAVSSSTVKKSVAEIAKEVLQGTWGNGQDRKNKIIAAGYNYNEVQAAANKLV